MTRRRLSQDEERLFAAMWNAGASGEQIAAAFGLAGDGSVWSVRKRLGLPPRTERSKAPAAPGGETGSDAPGSLKVPAMPPHPFWDPLKDMAVLQTGGRHRAVEDLAVTLGKPRVAIVQRWHQLRAA